MPKLPKIAEIENRGFRRGDAERDRKDKILPLMNADDNDLNGLAESLELAKIGH